MRIHFSQIKFLTTVISELSYRECSGEHGGGNLASSTTYFTRIKLPNITTITNDAVMEHPYSSFGYPFQFLRTDHRASAARNFKSLNQSAHRWDRCDMTLCIAAVKMWWGLNEFDGMINIFHPVEGYHEGWFKLFDYGKIFSCKILFPNRYLLRSFILMGFRFWWSHLYDINSSRSFFWSALCTLME